MRQSVCLLVVLSVVAGGNVLLTLCHAHSEPHTPCFVPAEMRTAGPSTAHSGVGGARASKDQPQENATEPAPSDLNPSPSREDLTQSPQISVLPWGTNAVRLRIAAPGQAVDLTDRFGAFADGAPRPSPGPTVRNDVSPHSDVSQQHAHIGATVTGAEAGNRGGSTGEGGELVTNGAITAVVRPESVEFLRSEDSKPLFTLPLSSLVFGPTRYGSVYAMNVSTPLDSDEQVMGFGQHQVRLPVRVAPV